MIKLKNYPKYSIFKNGRVKNTLTGIYPSVFLRSGYPSIAVTKNGIQKLVRIHRLLAETFIPNPKKHRIVNHKNGIKTDYRLCNLEWCSYTHNNKHSYLKGLNVPKNGGESHASKLVYEEVKEIRMLLKDYSQNHIAKLYKVSRGAIQAIANGKSWGSK